jgi:hypothetical protein
MVVRMATRGEIQFTVGVLYYGGAVLSLVLLTSSFYFNTTILIRFLLFISGVGLLLLSILGFKHLKKLQFG